MRVLDAALGQAMVYDWKRHVQGQAASARGSIASMLLQKRARQVDEEEAAAANDGVQASDDLASRPFKHAFSDLFSPGREGLVMSLRPVWKS